LAPLIADGLVFRRGSILQVSEEARPLVRAVAAAFDAYLIDGTQRHVAAV
jgi:oxygen-independent coproporphyrinogen III oxidase